MSDDQAAPAAETPHVQHRHDRGRARPRREPAHGQRRRRRHLPPPPDRRERPRRRQSKTPTTPPWSASRTVRSSGHGRQGRPGRGPARHRLQVRGRHPQPRAVDPQRRRPRRGRVSMGDDIEALVLTKEDKDGRLRPLQEAGPVRAGLGQHREDQGRGRRRLRSGDRGRQGRPDHRHRSARLPAGVAGRAPPGP